MASELSTSERRRFRELFGSAHADAILTNLAPTAPRL